MRPNSLNPEFSRPLVLRYLVSGRGLAFRVLGYGVQVQLEALGVLGHDLPPVRLMSTPVATTRAVPPMMMTIFLFFLNRFFNLSVTEVVSSS